MPRRPSPPTPCPGGWPAAPTSVTPAGRGTSADLPSRERRQLMPYAEGRTFYDADSHLMETSGWLASYADPGIRERLRPLYIDGRGALADEAFRSAESTSGDPAGAAGP